MKVGKAKLKRILSIETGIPIKDIGIYGKYKCSGSEERLEIGSHVMVVENDRIFLLSPVIKEDSEDITYQTREIK